MISKEDKLYITRYYDVYGGLLTERALTMLKMYYDNDMSLAEVAEEYGISRQAVRDTIVRTEEQLREYENALGLIKLYDEIGSKVSTIIKCVEQNDSAEVIDIASKILEIISK